MTEDDLKAKARSRLPGVLRQLISGENPFPVPIGFARPKNTGEPSVILKVRDLLRAQSKAVVGFGPTITFEAANTRRYGRGELPADISFTTLDDLTVYVGRKAWADRILANVAALTAIVPEARAWATRHIDKLAEGQEERWTGIARVVGCLRDHPQPGIFPRQLPVPVHTKFIEDNYTEIISLLSAVAPQALVSGQDWRARLGFIDSPALIEGRFLDPKIAPHLPLHLLAPMEDWERCDLGKPRVVLITENRTTFLTLPRLASVLSFLGMGYAVPRLARLGIFATTRVVYWGDIDAQGFEILAQLRRVVPHAESIMMDLATYTPWQRFSGAGNPTLMESPVTVRSRLTAAEAAAFAHCLADNKRLEQERLAQAFIDGCLSSL